MKSIGKTIEELKEELKQKTGQGCMSDKHHTTKGHLLRLGPESSDSIPTEFMLSQENAVNRVNKKMSC